MGSPLYQRLRNVFNELWFRIFTSLYAYVPIYYDQDCRRTCYTFLESWDHEKNKKYVVNFFLSLITGLLTIIYLIMHGFWQCVKNGPIGLKLGTVRNSLVLNTMRMVWEHIFVYFNHRSKSFSLAHNFAAVSRIWCPKFIELYAVSHINL